MIALYLFAWRSKPLLNTARLDPLFGRTAGEVAAHFGITALFSFIGKSLVLGRSCPAFSRSLKCLGALFSFVGHWQFSRS